jgi:hypothetical protein
MNYSFDYDNTLIRYKYIYDEDGNITDAVYDRPHQENINLLRELASEGHRIYIVTARTPGLVFDRYIDNSPMPSELVKVLNLPVEDIFYTRNGCKLPVLLENNISAHWDDCPEQCERIRKTGLLRIHEVSAPLGINDFLKSKFIRLMEERA